jgi:hypothetical protein
LFLFANVTRVKCRFAFFLAGVVLFSASFLSAKDYYLDPENGSLTNDGSASAPWPSLQAVMSSSTTFVGGDVLHLLSGYHGDVLVRNRAATAMITVRAADGENPTLRRLQVQNSSYWTFEGLEISPEAAGVVDQGAIVRFENGCSNLVLRECFVYNIKDASGITDGAELTAKLGRGLSINASGSLIENNHLKNLNYAIETSSSAQNIILRNNLIEEVLGDGIRILSANSIVEGNTIQDFYGVDRHHDDGIQAWSVDSNGTAGEGVLKGLIIRNNKIIDRTKPDERFEIPYGVQGIGFFDGFFEDCVFENNLIVTDMWHGLSLYGAINCRIVNNTVVTSPFRPLGTTPWIGVYDHKTRGPSTGNLVVNNLASDLKFGSAMGTARANIVSTAFDTHFVDYENYDFHLSPTSQAIDRGVVLEDEDQRVTEDLEGHPRDAKPDLGAYEFVDPTVSLFPSAEKQSGFRIFAVDWIGTGVLRAGTFPWILHDRHGWWWVGDSTPERYWFYDLALADWLYGSPSSPHTFYSLKESAWIYHYPSSGDKGSERWFYHYATGQWELS